MAAYVRSARFQELFGATPRTLSLGSAVGSGNSMIVLVRPNYDVSGNDITVSDNQSNTYTVDFDTLDYDGTSQIVFARCHNITNGPTELSFSWSGGDSRYLAVAWMEVSGLANAAPSDTQRTNLAFGTSISDTLTSTGASAFGVAFIDPNGRDITPQSGFSREPTTGSSRDIWMYDDDLGAAGDKTFGATWTGDTQAVMWSLIYEAASGGGGDTTLLIPRRRITVRKRLAA